MGYALHQCIWRCDKEAEHRAPWLDSSVLHRVLLSMDIILMFKKQKSARIRIFPSSDRCPTRRSREERLWQLQLHS